MTPPLQHSGAGQALTLVALSERLENYKRHCEILRQIHSNKAARYKRRADVHSLLLTGVSAFATFLGFTGVSRLFALLGQKLGWSLAAFEFAFNSMVFLILALTILNLVFRFHERAAEHNRAIVQLTGLIRDLDDQLLVVGSVRAPIRLLREVRQRYKSITESLPASTDREFFKSKLDYLEKRRRSLAISRGEEPVSKWNLIKRLFGKRSNQTSG
jgi:hypothetical protein